MKRSLMQLWAAMLISTGCHASSDNKAMLVNGPTPVPSATQFVATLPTPSMINGGTLNDKAIRLPQPTYPRAAMAANVSGTVQVQVVVNRAGDVVQASAFSGPTLLWSAAEKAAKLAKFEPTISDGAVKPMTGTLEYIFKPN